jgi:hypothetical protein
VTIEVAVIQEARFATLLQKLGQEKIINIVTLALAVSWYAEITKAVDQVTSRLYLNRLYEGLELVRRVLSGAGIDIALLEEVTSFTERYFADKVEAAGPTH